MCSKKLTGSQLSPPHGTNKKLNCETKNKTMSMIGPVQSRKVMTVKHVEGPPNVQNRVKKLLTYSAGALSVVL